MRIFLSIFALVTAGSLLSAQEKSAEVRFKEAATSVQKDLRIALNELATFRQEIAKEKLSLAKETNRIAAELREARRKADLAKTSREAIETEFAKSENDIKIWREERNYIEGLLLDFQKTYQATGSLAKIEAERELLSKQDFESRFVLVEKVMGQLKESGKIEVFSGEALNEKGVLVTGKFADAGPVSWFLSEDSRASGLISAGNDLRPRIVAGTADSSAIELLLRGQSSTPTFDPTLGAAVALTRSDTSITDHIKQGGFWIYPILILAAIALSAALTKWVQLLKIREFRPSIVQGVIDAVTEGEFDAARSTADSIRHPAKQILKQGIEILEKSPQSARDDVEESLYERFLEALPGLSRGLPLIAIASATAPLLGLLGTVTGMIETFRLIDIFGTGDAKSLASGISEALVTTEFGLIVAIPALILHALLSRKVQGIKSAMEMTSLAFLNGIKSP